MNETHNTELILSPKGNIYHLDLKPGEVAKNIILVGDPARVPFITSLFSTIEIKRHKREFISHTGMYKGKRISVISTGIGTGNIDIVMNELDALFNIDFKTKSPKENLTSLSIFRIGTSGALHPDIKPGTSIFSRYCIGMDNLLSFYNLINTETEKGFINALSTHLPSSIPFYFVGADDELSNTIGKDYLNGITVVAPGFYAPQAREIRTAIKYPDLLNHLSEFRHNGYAITNLEMEASAVYGMGRVLGHKCCAVDLILANRIRKQFLSDYDNEMRELALRVLDGIVGGRS
ncbi:MAG: nucleoside phosphorylase [Bacteroidetes bacterium]|nr:nucleoside phosphorylase [Bacteroidota bacterium]